VEQQTMKKGFSTDRDAFQEVLASAFLVQHSKLDKEFTNSVAELEQLMERDHFSVDTIADLPVEESPELPISEDAARSSSQYQPSSAEELETFLPVDTVSNPEELIGSDDPWTSPLTVLVILEVLILGWMLGRVTLRNTETKPKPAIHAPSQASLDSWEQNSQGDVSPPPEILPKKKNAQMISDSLVIYQNGRVIFRTDPPSASPRLEPGAKAERSSDGSETLRVTYKIKPQYPEVAKQQHIEGPVLMEAVIGGNGEVQQLDVVNGSPILAGAASAAVRKWRFTLPRNRSLGGFVIRITVNFRLK
jgi:TonB family protein